MLRRQIKPIINTNPRVKPALPATKVDEPTPTKQETDNKPIKKNKNKKNKLTETL